MYVCWNTDDSLLGGDHWASNACYSVYDGSTLLAQVDVNQQDTCPSDSPNPSDHPWKLLGVYNITSGTVNVQLCDGNNNPSYGEMLDFNDVMIRPIWPTVSIRADQDGTGQFSAYDDYLNAIDPAEIPVEGDGVPRLAVQLSASVDPLYAQIAGASMGDWQVVLPNLAGLEFWTAATGGTQLTPDGSGDLVDQPLSGSGQYQGMVWVSVNPSYGDPADISQIAFTLDPDGASVTANLQAAAIGTWTANNDWTQNLTTLKYSGTAEAHGAASLKQLALFITGNPSDWTKIKIIKGSASKNDPSLVTDATQVDISGLLQSLDETLHGNVVAAANTPKNAKFPLSPAWSLNNVQGYNQAAINDVFTTGGYVRTFDCYAMRQAIEARALILTLDNNTGIDGTKKYFADEFDKMDLTLGRVSRLDSTGLLWVDNRYTLPLDKIQPGDSTGFANANDYLATHVDGAPWQAENVIMVGKDSFYGWNLPKPMSYAQWQDLFVTKYNTANRKPGVTKTIAKTDLPAFNQEVGFFNVPKLAKMIFKFRQSEKPAAQD